MKTLVIIQVYFYLPLPPLTRQPEPRRAAGPDVHVRVECSGGGRATCRRRPLPDQDVPQRRGHPPGHRLWPHRAPAHLQGPVPQPEERSGTKLTTVHSQ